MRLRRIQSVSFGAIDGRTLGEFSPRITIVSGPNEAGKSSFTALVRHVLYGFPTPGDVKEPPYMPASGRREARLVFGDATGEWVIERTEAPRGGLAVVRTLEGEPRDDLVSELTSGVGRTGYRVVFGFGLADMRHVAELKGKDDDLFEKFYAAGAGLRIGPGDIRAELEAAMSSLWKKGGSAPELNQARAARERARGERRALEAEEEALRSDAARLDTSEGDLEAARVARTESRARAESILRAVAEIERRLAEAEIAQREAERLAREAESARAAAPAAEIDSAVVAASDTVDALSSELSGFREQVAAIASEEARLAAIETRLRTAVGDCGWSLEQALQAAADVGAGTELESFRERLSRAQVRLDLAVSAQDAARTDGAGAVDPGASGLRSWTVPGIVVAVIGLAGAVAGLALSQTFLTAFAAVLIVVGAILAWIGSGRRNPTVGPASVARSDSIHDEARAAREALEAVRAPWSDWVRSRGFGDGTEDPAAVAARYQAARTVRQAEGERAESRASLARARDAAEAYAGRVRAVAAPLVQEPAESVTLERVTEVVNRARARVSETRLLDESVREAGAQAERFEREAREDSARAEREIAEAAETARRAGAEDGTLEGARLIEVAARTLADEADGACDRLSQEVTALRTRLGSERRDTALADLRLTEETLGEQIAAGCEEYVVLSLASKLLTLAQGRYERDRQPAIVKSAQTAFASMTGGRYVRISVPLGKDAIEVFDVSDAATSPGRLSRGTAEQMYLALRFGLLDQLGDVGAGLPVLMDDVLVNFSPERAERAAQAIADLSVRRQVVYFTCHPATADLLCAVAPDAVRLELEGPS